MNVNTLKSYEHNTSASEILSSYLMCKPELIIQTLVGDVQDTTNGLLEYWAEINNTEPFNVLDTIEWSLRRDISEFKFISVSPDGAGGFHCQIANTVLKLTNDIIIPLEWMLD